MCSTLTSCFTVWDFSIQPAPQAAPSASQALTSPPYTHTSTRQVPVCQPRDWYSPDLWQDLGWKQIIFNPAPSSPIQFRAQHQNSHTNTASWAGSPSQVWAGKNSCWAMGNAGFTAEATGCGFRGDLGATSCRSAHPTLYVSAFPGKPQWCGCKPP